MSTSAVHAHSSTSWKQEVNRRLAEHRGRKTASQPESGSLQQMPHNASRRAQEAAARVAARYANAPSYSEVLANEARAAIRAAEAASEAALQAKAAAECVLANIEAASAAMPVLEPDGVPDSADLEALSICAQISTEFAIVDEPARTEVGNSSLGRSQSLSVHWSTDLPGRVTEAAEFHAEQRMSDFQEDLWRPSSAEPIAPGAGEIEIIDPAMPIYGNLIEFPRELIATRKVRPRLTESPYAESSSQLSIFEVDPDMIATEASADSVQAAGADWPQPAWSGLEFGAQPFDEREESQEAAVSRREMQYHLEPASIQHRIMALFVDGTLISGALVGVAAFVLHSATALPSVRAMEHISAAALLLISALYMTLFYAVAPCTPGMKFAGIRFCTFEGDIPTSRQRWHRLGAMLLSVLPAGLGLAWSLFDDDKLSWHDRLSKTYICDC